MKNGQKIHWIKVSLRFVYYSFRIGTRFENILPFINFLI